MGVFDIINDFSKSNPLSVMVIILAITSVFTVIVKECNDKINNKR